MVRVIGSGQRPHPPSEPVFRVPMYPLDWSDGVLVRYPCQSGRPMSMWLANVSHWELTNAALPGVGVCQRVAVGSPMLLTLHLPDKGGMTNAVSWEA